MNKTAVEVKLNCRFFVVFSDERTPSVFWLKNQLLHKKKKFYGII